MDCYFFCLANKFGWFIRHKSAVSHYICPNYTLGTLRWTFFVRFQLTNLAGISKKGIFFNLIHFFDLSQFIRDIWVHLSFKTTLSKLNAKFLASFRRKFAFHLLMDFCGMKNQKERRFGWRLISLHFYNKLKETIF